MSEKESTFRWAVGTFITFIVAVTGFVAVWLNKAPDGTNVPQPDPTQAGPKDVTNVTPKHETVPPPPRRNGVTVPPPAPRGGVTVQPPKPLVNRK
jgi:hypothetical protein